MVVSWVDNAVQYQYVYSLRGEDMVVLRNTGSSLVYNSTNTQDYYLNDANGNVVALVENGSVVERYEYSAYGTVTVYSASWVQQSEAHDNTILFAGRELDVTTGLYYNRARWYDPSKGVFITRDPIAADANLYRYCGNNPVSYTDPTGLLADAQFVGLTVEGDNGRPQVTVIKIGGAAAKGTGVGTFLAVRFLSNTRGDGNVAFGYWKMRTYSYQKMKFIRTFQIRRSSWEIQLCSLKPRRRTAKVPYREPPPEASHLDIRTRTPCRAEGSNEGYHRRRCRSRSHHNMLREAGAGA